MRVLGCTRTDHSINNHTHLGVVNPMAMLQQNHECLAFGWITNQPSLLVMELMDDSLTQFVKKNVQILHSG